MREAHFDQLCVPASTWSSRWNNVWFLLWVSCWQAVGASYARNPRIHARHSQCLTFQSECAHVFIVSKWCYFEQTDQTCSTLHVATTIMLQDKVHSDPDRGIWQESCGGPTALWSVGDKQNGYNYVELVFRSFDIVVTRIKTCHWHVLVTFTQCSMWMNNSNQVPRIRSILRQPGIARCCWQWTHCKHSASRLTPVVLGGKRRTRWAQIGFDLQYL